MHNEPRSRGSPFRKIGPLERVCFCSVAGMTKDELTGDPGLPEPSAHEEDDTPQGTDSSGLQPKSNPDQKIPGKPMSDMAPHGQDGPGA